MLSYKQETSTVSSKTQEVVQKRGAGKSIRARKQKGCEGFHVRYRQRCYELTAAVDSFTEKIKNSMLAGIEEVKLEGKFQRK